MKTTKKPSTMATEGGNFRGGTDSGTAVEITNAAADLGKFGQPILNDEIIPVVINVLCLRH